MALVEKAHPWFLSVELVDNSGKSTVKRFEMQSADAAAASTDAGNIITALLAVTDCKIKSYQIQHVYVENALLLPLSGVESENQALLTVRLASDPTKFATHAIPGAKPGIFMAASGSGANDVDPGDAAVNSYLGMFTTGNEAFLSDGELADSSIYFKGKRRHVASRNS